MTRIFDYEDGERIELTESEYLYRVATFTYWRFTGKTYRPSGARIHYFVWGCQDFARLADGSRLCKYAEKTTHCLCENIIKDGECPKGIREA